MRRISVCFVESRKVEGMGERKVSSERMWEKGWKGHEEAQLRRMAALPFEEKLRWLEEAHRWVRRLIKSEGNQKKL